MKNKFRWGVIGPGKIADQFAKDVQETKNSELYAVASRSGAKEYVSRYQVPVVYDTYEALVADPDVDGVYIATPHTFHFENSRLCLEAGKPVLCEKPLTVNAKETEALIALSENKNIFLMEALWSRFLPVHRQVRKWLDNDEIGEILFVRSAFCFRGGGDAKGRWRNPELAGGTLLDLGIYPIAVSQWIMQENPVSVQAVSFMGETGVDERLAVNMQYESGIVSQWVSSFNFRMKNEMLIFGSKGNIRIPINFWQAQAVILEKDEKQTKLDLPFRGEGFEYEIEAAVNCIRAGEIECADMSHEDSLANIKLMDAIRDQIGLKYPFE